MLDVRALQAQDFQGLSHDGTVQLATALLAQLAAKDDQLVRRDSEIKFKDARSSASPSSWRA